MKFYKTKEEQVILKRTEYVDKICCDLCGKEDKQNNWDSDSCYDVQETEISWKTGFQYPEGGRGKDYSVDICPECFKGKLIPWVEGFGRNVTVKDWDN